MEVLVAPCERRIDRLCQFARRSWLPALDTYDVSELSPDLLLRHRVH